MLINRSFTRLAETSTKKHMLDDNVLPLYQNHIYTVLPPNHYLCGIVSQSYLRCCFPG